MCTCEKSMVHRVGDLLMTNTREHEMLLIMLCYDCKRFNWYKVCLFVFKSFLSEKYHCNSDTCKENDLYDKILAKPVLNLETKEHTF